MRHFKVFVASLFISTLCISDWSSGAAARGPAECEKLTGRDRSKCLGDARRNKSDGSDKNQPTSSKTKTPQTEPSKTSARPAQVPKATVWGRIDVPSPAGFMRYDQLKTADSRIYSSAQWAESMDTVSKKPRKELTCLSTVYAMIEHARGNSDFRVGSQNYTDKAGASRITGVGETAPLTDMETVRAQFIKGNPVILWGPLTRNPADQFGHFILAVGVNSGGQIVAHDPYGGQTVTINPATRKVSGSSAISTVDGYRTVKF